jgi:hypothetical protein
MKSVVRKAGEGGGGGRIRCTERGLQTVSKVTYTKLDKVLSSDHSMADYFKLLFRSLAIL